MEYNIGDVLYSIALRENFILKDIILTYNNEKIYMIQNIKDKYCYQMSKEKLDLNYIKVTNQTKENLKNNNLNKEKLENNIKK